MYKLKGTRKKPFAAYLPDKKLLGTFATAAEAVAALDAFNAQSAPLDLVKMTFADIYQAWSEQHYKDVGKSAVRQYKLAFTKSEPLHRRTFKDLRLIDYQRIIDTAVAAGLGRSSCVAISNLYAQLSKWALAQDIIPRDYSAGLRLPAAASKKERILTAEEIERIKADDSEIARVATVLVYTGLRISELLLMERDNVRFSEHYMIGGEKTTAGKNRIIPILPPIAPIIESWLTASDSVYLIPDRYGHARCYNSVREEFNRLMRRLGIEGVTAHTLRHTAATMMVEAGMEQTAIQQILGHSNFSTTADIYTSHTNKNYLLKEMQKIL